MKKAKTDKGWAGKKLFGHEYYQRDIRTAEDKRQDKILEELERKARDENYIQIQRNL